MAYTVPRFQYKDILAMSDDELFGSIKRLKRIISKKRKIGESTQNAEVEICYLQAEAQNRGHKV
jgi:hypothetical protein